MTDCRPAHLGHENSSKGRGQSATEVQKRSADTNHGTCVLCLHASCETCHDLVFKNEVSDADEIERHDELPNGIGLAQ